MRSTFPSELDDATIEALLRGDPPSSAQHLAPFVEGMRAIGDRRPPRPTPALTRFIAGDPQRESVPGPASARDEGAVPMTAARQRRLRRTLAGRAAGVAIAVKVGLGAVAAAAGVGGAASLHVLPGAPGSAVRDVISAVTPFELDSEPPAAPGEPAQPGGPTPADSVSPTDAAPDGTAGEFGDRVSSDATGESDGTPGVDGPSVAEDAPGQERRPTDSDPPAVGDRPETDPPPSSGEVGPSSTIGAGQDESPGAPAEETTPTTGEDTGANSDGTPDATARP